MTSSTVSEWQRGVGATQPMGAFGGASHCTVTVEAGTVTVFGTAACLVASDGLGAPECIKGCSLCGLLFVTVLVVGAPVWVLFLLALAAIYGLFQIASMAQRVNALDEAPGGGE